MFERLQEEINCIFERDPAARTLFEVVTTYPGFQAIVWHRVSYRLWRWGAKWLARTVSTLGRWLTGIEIHPGARIGRYFFIDHGMGVVIGETAEIGDGCTLYHGVTLGGTSWEKGKRHPTLGDNVVVGAGAKILGPIHIGSGARIGSNSVVVKSVPENATVVGVPGRVIGAKAPAKETRRRAVAKRIHFDPYGVSEDTPDPVERTLQGLVEHIQRLDTQIEQMTAEIQRLKEKGSEERSPDLESGGLSAGGDDETADSAADKETSAAAK